MNEENKIILGFVLKFILLNITFSVDYQEIIHVELDNWQARTAINCRRTKIGANTSLYSKFCAPDSFKHNKYLKTPVKTNTLTLHMSRCNAFLLLSLSKYIRMPTIILKYPLQTSPQNSGEKTVYQSNVSSDKCPAKRIANIIENINNDTRFVNISNSAKPNHITNSCSSNIFDFFFFFLQLFC